MFSLFILCRTKSVVFLIYVIILPIVVWRETLKNKIFFRSVFRIPLNDSLGEGSRSIIVRMLWREPTLRWMWGKKDDR